MSSTIPSTFACTNCGKKYTARPDLLGKKVRCTCGTVLSVPEAEQASPAAVDDGLYDFANDPVPLAKTKPGATAAIAAPALPISIPGMKDDEYPCPSCELRMEPGSIVCAHCGFNLKTGEKMNLGGPSKQPAKKLGSAFGVARLRTTPTIVIEDKKAQLLKMAIPAALIVVVVLAIVGYKMFAKHVAASAAPVNKDDAAVALLTEESGATEIHKWFKENPNRLAGEFSPTQALAKADQWQAMGAKQVLAFGGLMTRSLAIELPDDPQQRKALFEFENKFADQHHYPGAKDQGQKYLLLNLGL